MKRNVQVTVAVLIALILLASVLYRTAPVQDAFMRTGVAAMLSSCLLYTSPSPRDATLSRMPSSA